MQQQQQQQQQQEQDRNADIPFDELEWPEHALRFVNEFELFGNINSIRAVRFPGNNRDSLIIGFEEEAKVSVVDYDQGKQELKTVSLHYMEDEFLKEGRHQFFLTPTIRVDDQARCAALVIYESKLVIVPFKERLLAEFGSMDTDDEDDDDNDEKDETVDPRHKRREIPVKRQFLIDLKEMGLLHVKDYCFLHGYSYQPTLLILHENEPTWSGRFPVRRNTCSVTAISIDTSGEGTYHPVIWTVNALPHDCYRLIPLKEAVGGGALVCAYDSLWHVNQRATYALSLNDICQQHPDFSITIDVPATLNIRLDSAAYSFLTRDRILFSLRRGELYLLQIFNSGRAVQRMIMTRVTVSVLASCMCTVADRYLFIGSRMGDSLLVTYKEKKLILPTKAELEAKQRLQEQQERERQEQEGTPAAETGADGTAAGDDAFSAVEPAQKKQRLDNGTAATATNKNLESADDFLSALGETSTTAGDDSFDGEQPFDESEGYDDMEGYDDEEYDEYDEEGNVTAPRRSARSKRRPAAVGQGKDIDEFQEDMEAIYGTQAALDAQNMVREVISYDLQLRETMINIGPIVHMTIGEDAGSISKLQSKRNNMHIVSASGYGKNGSLCVLQRTVRPELVHEEKLPFTVQQMWGIHLSIPEERLQLLVAQKEKEREERWKKRKQQREERELARATRLQEKQKQQTVLDNEQQQREENGKDEKHPTEQDNNNDHDDDDDDDDDDDNMDYDDEDEQEEEEEEVNDMRSFLFFALDRSTKVLEAAADLNDITHRSEVGICKDNTTINVGSLASMNLGVQITTNRVVLFDCDMRSVEEIDLSKLGKRIHAAHIEDPFILLHFTDGTLQLLEYTGKVAEQRGGSVFNSKRKFGAMTQSLGKITAATLFTNSGSSELLLIASRKQVQQQQQTRTFCVVCWSSGAMELYTVPDFRPVFSYLRFDNMDRVLQDVNPSKDQLKQFATKTETIGSAPTSTAQQQKQTWVKEVRMRCVDGRHEHPHLFVMFNDDSLFVYRSFSHRSAKDAHTATNERLSHLRFLKIDADIVQRRMPDVPDAQQSAMYSAAATAEIELKLDDERDIFVLKSNNNSASVTGTTASTTNTAPTTTVVFRSKIVPFGSIAKQGGVFVCGGNPMWLFSDRGRVRAHPMPFDAPTTAFAPFQIFDSGFIIFSEKSSKFRVCTLSESALMSYNAHWPTRKVPLKATPHQLCYHEGTQSYVVATSTTIVAELPEDMIYPPEEKGRYPVVTEEKHELRLLDSNYRQVDKFGFDIKEQVLSVGAVLLSREDRDDSDDDYIIDIRPDKHENEDEKPKELFNMVAVGTGFDEGEDEAGRGKIYLFDFDAKINDKGEREYKLDLLTSRDVKGPVSALTHMHGYIIFSVGPKLFVYYYDWDAKQLIGASFFDTQYHVTSISTFKKYIVYGDLYKNVHFLRWRERGHKLIELSRDYVYQTSMRADFMVDDKMLQIVSSDGNKNLQVFAYQPFNPVTLAGKKLLPLMDVRLGQQMVTSFRMRPRKVAPMGVNPMQLVAATGTALSAHMQQQQQQEQRSLLVYGTLEGGIGYVIPIDEITYRRLNLLQLKMHTMLPHAAGLHPKRYRLFQPEDGRPYNLKKNIVDGQLIWVFNNLDFETQRNLARQSGTSALSVLTNIAHLDESTFFF